MALTHTDTGAHPRQSGFRPRRSPAPPLDPLKANIQVWRRRAEHPNAKWQTDHAKLDMLVMDVGRKPVRPHVEGN